MHERCGMADTISDAIEESAISGIKKVTEESTSVESHSLPDLIAAKRDANADSAAAKAHGGMRFSKFVPPGTV